MPQLIPNTQLRAEYQRRAKTEGLTSVELAARIGWLDGHEASEAGGRVLRTLGVTKCKRRGRAWQQAEVEPDTALALARGLHLDPVDIGL